MAKEKTNDALAEGARDAAGKLADALSAVKEAGLVVSWPQSIEQLRELSVSETAASQARAAGQEAPTDGAVKPAAEQGKGAPAKP